MFLASLLLATVASAGTVSRSFDAADDVRTWLAELASADGDVRAQAQRRLAASLAREHTDLVVASLRDGDAEVRGRLVEALGADDRRLALAVDLAVRDEPYASTAGTAAIELAIQRWDPGCRRTGLARAELVVRLKDEFLQPIEIDGALATLPLDELGDLIVRASPVVPPLVVDPTVDRAVDASVAGSAPRERTIDGTFDRVLNVLVRTRRIECRGFGFEEKPEPGAAKWICLVTRDASEREPTASDRMVAWTLATRRAKTPAERAAQAGALARTGWPAGIAWLEERWRVDHDEAALAGLLASARRGRVPSSLFDATLQRELFRRMQAESDPRRACAIASALAATGPVDTNGVDLSPLVLEGFDALTPRERWMRLVVLEGRGGPPAAFESLAASCARDVGHDAPSFAVRLQALRASAGSPVRLPLGEPEPLLIAALRTPSAREEFFDLVRGRTDWPPAEWRDPEHVPAAVKALERVSTTDVKPANASQTGAKPASASWTGADVADAWLARARLADAWLARGDVQAAADHVSAALALASDEGARIALASALSSCVRSAGRAEYAHVFDQARASRPQLDLALARLQALAGCADAAIAVRLATGDAGRAGPATGEDLLVLGSLAASASGAMTRAALLLAVKGSLPVEARIAALDRAVEALRAARAEDDESAFVTGVRDAAHGADPALKARLRVDLWPAPPAREPVRLSTIDRDPVRAGL